VCYRCRNTVCFSERWVLSIRVKTSSTYEEVIRIFTRCSTVLVTKVSSDTHSIEPVTLVHVIGNAKLCNADRSTGTSVPLDCFVTKTVICRQTISYSETKRFVRADGGTRSLLILLLLLFPVLYHSNLFQSAFGASKT
jgi:hypothetical protein